MEQWVALVKFRMSRQDEFLFFVFSQQYSAFYCAGEHLWPRSYGLTYGPSLTDIHNIRPADVNGQFVFDT